MIENQLLSRSGGIGRHAILRGWWATARASSILAFGTKTDKGISKRMLKSLFSCLIPLKYLRKLPCWFNLTLYPVMVPVLAPTAQYFEIFSETPAGIALHNASQFVYFTEHPGFRLTIKKGISIFRLIPCFIMVGATGFEPATTRPPV